MAGKPPPDWLAPLIKEAAGRGVSDLLVDRAASLEDPFDEPWVTALEELRHKGTKAKLLALLRSDAELTSRGREFLADMLERYDLKRPANRPRTPVYDLPPSEANLYYAMKDVRERDQRPNRRMRVADAIKIAAAQCVSRSSR